MSEWQSSQNPMFRSAFAEDIFTQKYKHENAETWEELAKTLVNDVCGRFVPKDVQEAIVQAIIEMKFIPGGRYLYYAGKRKKFFNNCYLLASLEDTREDWASLSQRVELCLSTGGGVGNDYSIYRPSGNILHGTGGVASGPLPKMEMVNELGRCIMQGGSRRSALYASLNHTHGDVYSFLKMKNWYDMKVAGTTKNIGQLKEADFNYRAPMDMTNISVNYDTDWLLNYWKTGDVGDVFKENIKQALKTGEPGFSFNFFDKEGETLRNACTEVTSSDDSDVCNLGSVNLGRIDDVTELHTIVNLGTIFLLCGTLVADLPYEKVGIVREKNRRLGLGLMGIHEWLLKRGYKYDVAPELKRWLYIYKTTSDATSREQADRLSISRPVANRAIAPTGTIGILAGTTTGIEPVFAVAYKRRYLKDGKNWKYQYVIDSTANELIRRYGVKPEDVESSVDLATDYERRIKFQADIQDFVDMGISSTINLPEYKEDDRKITEFTEVLAKHAHRLRGFTCYPDGARGGQPITSVPYNVAIKNLGKEYEEAIETHDSCSITGHGGTCGA